MLGHDGIEHQGIPGAAALIDVFFVGFEIIGGDGGLVSSGSGTKSLTVFSTLLN